MLETRTVHAPHGFAARLVRDPAGRDTPGWWVLLCDADQDELWLCVGTLPAGVELHRVDFPLGAGAVEYRKLCALLGWEWVLLEADFVKLAGWQQSCQALMGAAVRRSIANAAVEDIAKWRHDISSNPAGMVRAALTGDDPRAVAN